MCFSSANFWLSEFVLHFKDVLAAETVVSGSTGQARLLSQTDESPLPWLAPPVTPDSQSGALQDAVGGLWAFPGGLWAANTVSFKVLFLEWASSVICNWYTASIFKTYNT